MAQQSWVALANDVPPITGITSNTYTTPTANGAGDLTVGNSGTKGFILNIPGNFFRAGQSWRITAAGTYAVTGTPTHSWGIYIGSALQASTPATNALATTGNPLNWFLNAYGTIRSLGPSTGGTSIWSGQLSYCTTNNSTFATATTGLAYEPLSNATAVDTPLAFAAGANGFDTTIANELWIGGHWSASSASNQIVLTQFLVEYLN